MLATPEQLKSSPPGDPTSYSVDSRTVAESNVHRWWGGGMHEPSVCSSPSPVVHTPEPHDSHAPWHARSQQTPSTQNPLLHSAPMKHVLPRSPGRSVDEPAPVPLALEPPELLVAGLPAPAPLSSSDVSSKGTSAVKKLHAAMPLTIIA